MEMDLWKFDFNGKKVRIVQDEHGEPWFVAKDVAEVFGYARPNDAVAAHCKAYQMVKISTVNRRGNPNVTIIPERDVYWLVMRSPLPEAEAFEEWVVGEVLPSIRKHGGYIQGQEELTDDELMARALLMAQSKIEDEQGESWFVGKDVCDVLGIKNIRQNTDVLDEDEKGVSNIYTLSGKQRMTVVSESGLYALVLKSRKPQAKAFRRWITHEVIPYIRMHGGYIQGQEEGGLGWICRNSILTGREFAFYKMRKGSRGLWRRMLLMCWGIGMLLI